MHGQPLRVLYIINAEKMRQSLLRTKSGWYKRETHLHSWRSSTRSRGHCQPDVKYRNPAGVIRAAGQSRVASMTVRGRTVEPSSSPSDFRSARTSSSSWTCCRLAFSRDAHDSIASRPPSSVTSSLPRDVTFTSVSTFTCSSLYNVHDVIYHCHHRHHHHKQ